MKGPTLSSRSDILPGKNTESELTPEERIAAFSDEILSAIPVEEFERLEDRGNWKAARARAEIAALYLARFWHYESPWWGDEALRMIFAEGLPVTKAVGVTHARAADLRLADKGQKKTVFLRQQWEDRAFFQVAAMRAAGVSAREASHQAARWRDELSNGDSTVMASTIQKGYPKWAAGPLRGMVWCSQLSREMRGLSPSQKLNLIQCNKLRAVMLPPCPEGLVGERR